MVPEQVDMARAWIVLKQRGLFHHIDTTLRILPEPMYTVAVTAWERSPYISRNGALVKALASIAGLSEQDLDDLFIAAEALQL